MPYWPGRAGLLALCLVLCACSENTESPTAETAVPAAGEEVVSEVAEEEAEEEATEAADEAIPVVLGEQLSAHHYDLNGLKERGVLRVLVGYSHTHYFMDGLHIRGISAENIREFEPFLQSSLGSPQPPINVLPIPVARDQMIDYLARGMGDIAIGNITVTDERALAVDFSIPLRRDVAEIIVHNSDSTPIVDLDDLSGRSVFVRESSSFHESLGFLNLSLAAKNLAPVKVLLVDENLQTEDILELVNAGIFDMTVADDHMAEFWSGVHKNLVVRSDLPIRTGRAIAWAIRKDLTGMKPIVDEFVRAHRQGTLVGNVLFQRYLQNNRYVHNASASADRRRFQNLTELFQRYSSDYDFDWLLIAAQGYQESRLVQKLRSPAGAIGVMQLLPSTANGASVAIPNIDELEANIHAGHKYLRHIADTYFSSPEIDELNQQLFSFAAYNAGPTRISRLRREALSRGLNANVWFGQVEQVVAERVGMEPVTYVRNIFKYYLTYKLMRERETRLHNNTESN